jgi:hypothetical protein
LITYYSPARALVPRRPQDSDALVTGRCHLGHPLGGLTGGAAVHSATPSRTETAAVLDGEFCDRGLVGPVLLDARRVTASGERL